MKDFHHNYLCRPTENAKKEQKTSRSHHCSMCKCVKLHYHDCPMIMHPCPLHGSPFQSEEKIEKVDRGQNVIISFHPSSRTERLLQPIKSLLANCKSETKINFQYYSPPNSISSESVRPNYGQNALEQLKRNLNNSLFMDRTKSFVVDKTNKVKKLKECFYSPCGSVARKSRSQTSIKDKLNQALFDDQKDPQNALYKFMSELPPNDLRNDWFSPRKLSNEKFQSDFITVTRHDKNNIINHKIFEIKHETEGDEVSYVGFPKPQNQFVYAAASVSESKPKKRFQFCKKKKKDVASGPDKPVFLKDTTSEKSTHLPDSSSSGSVYITPFFLVPKGTEYKDGNESDVSRPVSQNEKSVQAGESLSFKSSTKSTQADKHNEVNFKKPSTYEEPKTKSVILQTESYSPVSSRQTSGVRDPGPKTKIEEIYVDRVSNFMKPSDYSQSRQSGAMSSRTSKQSTQNTDVYQCKEISINARWGSGMRDQTSQTEELWSFQLSVKTFESKTNKSQGTSPRHSERGLQTVYYHNTMPSQNRSEFINIKVPQISSVKDQYPDSDDSDKVEKIWIGKSHSDSNVFDKGKCGYCRSDTENKDHKCTAKERPQVQDCSREKTSAPVADLSELKLYIRDLFEKENFSYKKCNCEKPKIDCSPFDYKSTQTSTTHGKFADAEIQTPRSEKPLNVEVQTSVSMNTDKNKNMEVQTDICVFLEGAEENSGGQKKVKVCRTVILDPDNESKTFFICTVCGRDITIISKNAATSTVDLRSAPFVKPSNRTSVNENEISKWTETHFEIKKVRKPSSKLNQKVPQCEKEKVQHCEREKVRPQSEREKVRPHSERGKAPPQCEKEKVQEKPPKTSKHQRCSLKSVITSRSRNENDISKNDSSNSGLGSNVLVTVDEKTQNFPPSTRDFQCECSCSSTSEHKFHSKPHQNENCPAKHSGKNTQNFSSQFTEHFYPVIISRMWPKQFIQNWESIETCLESSFNPEIDSQLQTIKQKRSYEKDFESTALGKRIKVEMEEKSSFKNPSPTVSGILIKGDDGGYKFLPSNFMDCTDFLNKKDLFDESEVQDSLSTLKLEDILQDDFLASIQTSEDIITSRSSFLTEPEERECEATVDESVISSLPNSPIVMPQSHSVFNFSSFSNSKVSSNLKSLNSFSFIGGSKKK